MYGLSLLTVFCGALLPALCVAGHNDTKFYSSLRKSVSNDTIVLYPYNPASPLAVNFTERWDVYTEPNYNGMIKPATVADLQATASTLSETAVSLATKHNIPFLTTAGGHGTSGTLARLQGGLNIDIGHFNTVELDPKTNTVTIGGSTHFAQLNDLLYDAGREIPPVSSTCVGVVGATLNAGIGIMQGIHGPLLDSLLSVRLITASGTLVEASEQQNPDLFWALRGAGSNFGIVTSATYKTYPRNNGGNVVNADFLYVAPQNGSVWEVMASFDKFLDPKLALTFFVIRDPSSGQPVLAVNAIYFGSPEELTPLLAPMYAINPVMTNVITVPTNRVYNYQFFGQTVGNGQCDDGNIVNIYTLSFKKTDAPTWTDHFNNLAAFYAAHPAYQGRLLIQKFPTQAGLAVPDDRTAYALREAKIHVNMEGWYTDRSLDKPVSDFLADARVRFQKTSGFPELSVYPGYAHGDEGVNAWYSSRKLKRLSALKKVWDRNGVFSWNNPVLCSRSDKRSAGN